MRKRPSEKQMKNECERFNKLNPIGSMVRFWTGRVHDSPGEVAEIVEPGAYIMGSHTAVVQVAGRGCVALTHVCPA